MFFDFHNPGAPPQVRHGESVLWRTFNLDVAPSALEAMRFHKCRSHRPVHLGARFHTKQAAQRAAATGFLKSL